MGAARQILVLVVDDELDARDALSELLKVCGYNVTCAENGLAALDQIEAWRAASG
jgi:CheY-like chemotaxis protein